MLLRLVRQLLEAPQLKNLQASQPAAATDMQQHQDVPTLASPSQLKLVAAGNVERPNAQQNLQQARLWACKCLAKTLQQLGGMQPGEGSEAVFSLFSGIPPVLAALMVTRLTRITRAAVLEVGICMQLALNSPLAALVFYCLLDTVCTLCLLMVQS